MVLLLQRVRVTPEYAIMIYIPLWFYFYSNGATWRTDHAKFTFHYGSTSTQIPPPDNRTGYSFTFHYGSTSTRFLLSIVIFFSAFTFHYGSTSTSFRCTSCRHNNWIYIPLWFYFYQEQSWQFFPTFYLHSTMVLLLRKIDQLAKLPIQIYIPLWFYFYRYAPAACRIVCEFTFHYGSTSTVA